MATIFEKNYGDREGFEDHADYVGLCVKLNFMPRVHSRIMLLPSAYRRRGAFLLGARETHQERFPDHSAILPVQEGSERRGDCDGHQN